MKKFKYLMIAAIAAAVLVCSVFSINAQGKYGDVNSDGVVNLKDAVVLQKYLLEMEDLNSEQQMYADVNADGKINLLDVIYIQQYCMEKINKFPAEDVTQPTTQASTQPTTQAATQASTDSDGWNNIVVKP